MRFERYILDVKVRIEAGLEPDEVVFPGRAVPDSIAYFEMAGFDPQMPANRSTLFKHKAVFLFERLGFTVATVRSEDEETAMSLDRLLEKAYRSLGYGITRVPVMPVEQRVERILSYLE